MRMRFLNCLMSLMIADADHGGGDNNCVEDKRCSRYIIDDLIYSMNALDKYIVGIPLALLSNT